MRPRMARDTSVWTSCPCHNGLPKHAAWRPFRAVSRHQRAAQRFLVTAEIRKFSERDVKIESSVGSIGYVNIKSTSSRLSDTESRLLQLTAQEETTDGGVQARLYTGKIIRGELFNAKVLLKAYKSKGLPEADNMAANEVAAHTALQPPAVKEESGYLVKLMGSFTKGSLNMEQWNVFRRDGTTTAAEYAAMAAKAGAKPVGDSEFWDMFDKKRPLARRRLFVLRMLRQVLKGLAFMHSRHRLHQSLGPSSILLNSTDESMPWRLQARLSDLALAVDASDEALFGGATLGEIWDRGTIYDQDPLKQMANGLWMRAREAGAWTELERRSYGAADDIYAAGQLLAYMVFVPFCPPNSIDGPMLQRLLGTTFRDDMASAREYFAADDRYAAAVEVLDMGNRAGWDLLQAVLSPDWRLRPTAEACLKHPFLLAEELQRGLDD